MEITCPNPTCGKKFNWEPPKSEPVFRKITAETIGEMTQRYTAMCPYCKTRISIHV